MDIEDVFGDYQNGNYNVGNNSNAANDFLTSTETKMGGGSNQNGSGQKPPKPPKQKKKGGGGIIVFLLLILILLGAFAFLYFKTDVLSSLLKKSTPKESFMSTISAGVKEYSSIGKTARSKIITDGDMTIDGSYQTKGTGTGTDTKYEYSASKKDGYLGVNVKGMLDVVVSDNTLYLGDSSLEADKKYIGLRNENLDKVYETFLASENSNYEMPSSITINGNQAALYETIKNNIATIVSNDFNNAFAEEKFVKEEATLSIKDEDTAVTKYALKVTRDELIDFAKTTYDDILNDKDVKAFLESIGLYDYFENGEKNIDSEDSSDVNEITINVYELKGNFVGFRFETDKNDYYQITKTDVNDNSVTYLFDFSMDEEESPSTSEVVVSGTEVGYSVSTKGLSGDEEDSYSRTAISNISPEGYEYSVESSSGASSIVVSGKVRYEFNEDSVIEVKPEEAYMLNDVETEEDKENVENFVTAFVMKFVFGSMANGGFSGGGTSDLFPITDDPANVVTNTVTDPISNTIPDVTNTVIDENPVIETPTVDVKSYSLYNTVLEEVKNVLTACITESQNNQMDITNYLNVGNLTTNCPSLLTATLEKVGDSQFEGILTDTEGKQYKLVVDVDGFSSLTFDIVNP